MKDRLKALGRCLHEATDYLSDRFEEILCAFLSVVVIACGIAIVLKTLKWALV